MDRRSANRLMSTAAAVIVSTALASAARAQVVLGTDETDTPILSVPARGFTEFSGTFLSSLTNSFSTTFNGVTISGTVTAAVYSGGDQQTISGTSFGGTDGSGNGHLDFYYQLRLNDGTPTDTDVVSQLALSSFTGFSVAAAQITPDGTSATNSGSGEQFYFSSSTAPSSSSTSEILASGKTVDFNFDNNVSGDSSVPPGGYTDILIVRTTATSYATNGIASPAGTISTNLLTLTPNAGTDSVPEPGSMALAGTALVGMSAAWLKRRRQTN